LIWLHVEEGNAAAIRLYEANGYRIEGTRENYYPLGGAALICLKAGRVTLGYPLTPMEPKPGFRGKIAVDVLSVPIVGALDRTAIEMARRLDRRQRLRVRDGCKRQQA